MSSSIPRINEIFEQKYEILEILGSGGLGTVFRARQIDAERIIALKVLHQHVAEDEEFQKRFMREAMALSKLSDAHIVTIYHLGVSEAGLPFIAMELVEGNTLNQLIQKEGPLTPKRSIKIGRQICQALSTVHAAGIIHRDMKPDNVILLNSPESDFAKIIDFGLAGFEGPGKEQKLTATGQLLGSVSYMSPEQCQGKKCDARSDIYSLTVCFYEMISGKRPFDADTAVGIMYKHMNEAVPSLSLPYAKSLLTSLNDFLSKGMNKDPESRFSSASQMDEELQKLAALAESERTSVNLPSAKTLSIFSAGLLVTASAYFIYREFKKGSVKQDNFDQKTLKSRSLQELLKKSPGSVRYQSPAAKIKTLIQFAHSHPSGLDGIEAAKQAFELAFTHKHTLKEGVYEDACLSLAKAYGARGDSKNALSPLRQFLSGSQNTSVKRLAYIKSLASLYLLDLEENNKALSYIEDIANLDLDLEEQTNLNALEIAIHFKRTDLIERLLKQCLNTHVCMNLSMHCRRLNHPEYSRICMKRALETKDLGLFQQTNLDKLDFEVELEECRVEFANGNKSKAMSILDRLRTDPRYKRVRNISDNAGKLAMTMVRFGLLDEALQILSGEVRSHPSAVHIRAHVYCLQGRLKDARNCLNANPWVGTSGYGSYEEAQSILKQFESGKRDSSKGLILRGEF